MERNTRGRAQIAVSSNKPSERELASTDRNRPAFSPSPSLSLYLARYKYIFFFALPRKGALKSVSLELPAMEN